MCKYVQSDLALHFPLLYHWFLKRKPHPRPLTRSQTTNFRLFQTQRVCRRQFQIRWKWQKVFQTDRKNCEERRNCSSRAISPFPTVFSFLNTCTVDTYKPGLVWERVKPFKISFVVNDLNHFRIATKISPCPIENICRRQILGNIVGKGMKAGYQHFFFFFFHNVFNSFFPSRASNFVIV